MGACPVGGSEPFSVSGCHQPGTVEARMKAQLRELFGRAACWSLLECLGLAVPRAGQSPRTVTGMVEDGEEEASGRTGEAGGGPRVAMVERRALVSEGG